MASFTPSMLTSGLLEDATCLGPAHRPIGRWSGGATGRGSMGLVMGTCTPKHTREHACTRVHRIIRSKLTRCLSFGLGVQRPSPLPKVTVLCVSFQGRVGMEDLSYEPHFPMNTPESARRTAIVPDLGPRLRGSIRSSARSAHFVSA